MCDRECSITKMLHIHIYLLSACCGLNFKAELSASISSIASQLWYRWSLATHSTVPAWVSLFGNCYELVELVPECSMGYGMHPLSQWWRCCCQ